MLKEYLDADAARTQVLSILALIVESGSVYCALQVSIA